MHCLYQHGITANQVTLAACGISIFLGVVLSIFAAIPGMFWLLPVWFFLRMALNAIDGMLAREFGQQSALGAYLNEITDIVADAALYLPFAFVEPFQGWDVALVIWLAAMTEFCGILGQVYGRGRCYRGPMGKSDRAFVFGTLGCAYAWFGNLPEWVGSLMLLLIALLIYTCVGRVKDGLKREAVSKQKYWE